MNNIINSIKKLLKFLKIPKKVNRVIIIIILLVVKEDLKKSLEIQKYLLNLDLKKVMKKNK